MARVSPTHIRKDPFCPSHSHTAPSFLDRRHIRLVFPNRIHMAAFYPIHIRMDPFFPIHTHRVAFSQDHTHMGLVFPTHSRTASFYPNRIRRDLSFPGHTHRGSSSIPSASSSRQSFASSSSHIRPPSPHCPQFGTEGVVLALHQALSQIHPAQIVKIFPHLRLLRCAKEKGP